MITEDYVSLEVAKLLEEKGYKGPFNNYYNDAGCVVNRPNALLKEPKYQYYKRVSLQTAMKWLRKVHHLEMILNFGFPYGKFTYYWSVAKVHDDHLSYPMQDPNDAEFTYDRADTKEDACEGFIKYCLKNLL